MLISVIVPFYNAAAHLERCVSSLLEQTYGDIEILLINDGSTDQGSEIAQNIVLKDKRIKLFYKENGGVSSARNLGLAQAKGAWLAFVDSDDVVLPDYINQLLKEVTTTDAFVIQGMIRKTIGIEKENKFLCFDNEMFTLTSILDEKNITELGYAVGKLYNTEIVQCEGILFDEKINFAEDALFMLAYLKKVDYLYLSATKNYIYHEYSNSLVKRKYSYSKESALLSKAEELLENLYLKCNIHFSENAYILHLSYYLSRVLNSVMAESIKFKRIELLRRLFTNRRAELSSIYKRSKGRGRLLYFLIRSNNVSLFEYFYIKLIAQPA